MPLRLSVPAALIIALTISACSDSTEPEPSQSGSLSFTYSGARTGDFLVSWKYAPGLDPSSFAAALESAPGSFLLTAIRTSEGDEGVLGKALYLGIDGAMTTGTYGATSGSLLLQTDANSPQTASNFDLVSGVVVLTEIEGNQISGTFSGTFVSLAIPTEGAPDSVKITDGRFDIPVLEAAFQTR
ncbi:MAG TPA: hypothetical protein VFI91_00105 [Longimicrobiaceae bacterium]|nr:hypothetical protein [Longimicrobiaceae bacterium]